MNHTTGINKVKWTPLAAILGTLLMVTNLFLHYAVFHEYRLVNSFLLLGFLFYFPFMPIQNIMPAIDRNGILFLCC